MIAAVWDVARWLLLLWAAIGLVFLAWVNTDPRRKRDYTLAASVLVVVLWPFILYVAVKKGWAEVMKEK